MKDIYDKLLINIRIKHGSTIEFCQEFGIKHQTLLKQLLKKDMKLSRLEYYFNLLGYELILLRRKKS